MYLSFRFKVYSCLLASLLGSVLGSLIGITIIGYWPELLTIVWKVLGYLYGGTIVGMEFGYLIKKLYMRFNKY